MPDFEQISKFQMNQETTLSIFQFFVLL